MATKVSVRGIGRHVLFLAVAGNAFAIDDPWPVLSANGSAQNVFRAQRLDGMQNLALLIAHRIRAGKKSAAPST